jgi:hypothetical protein
MGKKPLCPFKHNSLDIAGGSLEKRMRYACKSKLVFVSASYVQIPCTNLANSSINGMKKESSALGECGPGMTTIGIRFSSRVLTSGGREKLISMIGHAKLLWLFPSASLILKTYDTVNFKKQG